MGTISFINNTELDIYVSVTAMGESGDESFFTIQPGGQQDWSRSNTQAAFVYRVDSQETLTKVVFVGQPPYSIM